MLDSVWSRTPKASGKKGSVQTIKRGWKTGPGPLGPAKRVQVQGGDAASGGDQKAAERPRRSGRHGPGRGSRVREDSGGVAGLPGPRAAPGCTPGILRTRFRARRLSRTRPLVEVRLSEAACALLAGRDHVLLSRPYSPQGSWSPRLCFPGSCTSFPETGPTAHALRLSARALVRPRASRGNVGRKEGPSHLFLPITPFPVS